MCSNFQAGGFFTEMYYWDSYWIIEGLLLCDMHTTARGIIENFFHLINTLGYMPNANRKYYLGRSQPPLLTRMVDAYYTATKDEQFLIQSLEVILIRISSTCPGIWYPLASGHCNPLDKRIYIRTFAPRYWKKNSSGGRIIAWWM